MNINSYVDSLHDIKSTIVLTPDSGPPTTQYNDIILHYCFTSKHVIHFLKSIYFLSLHKAYTNINVCLVL